MPMIVFICSAVSSLSPVSSSYFAPRDEKPEKNYCNKRFIYDTLLHQRCYMMTRNWTVFKGRSNISEKSEIYASINERNVVLINSAAFRALKAPEAVELCFDRANGVIGLRGVSKDAENAFPVKPKLKSHYVISISPFCKHFNIRVAGTMKFPEAELDENGLLILELTKTLRVSRTSRWY